MARSLRALRGRGRGADPGRAGLTAAVVEAVPCGVVACDADGRVVICNRRARQMLGSDPRMTGPDGPLDRALRGEDLAAAVLEVDPGDGPPIAVEVSAERMRGPGPGPGGEVIGAVMLLAGVADGPAVRGARDLPGAVVARLADAVLVVRAGDGRVVYANEAAEQLLGHGAAELVELHLSSLSVRGERFPEQRAREIAAALEHGGVWSGDIRLRHRDGAELWCAARVTGLEHSDHGAVWIFACSDAAGRRAAEAALADAETRFRTLFEHGPVPVALVGPDLRILDVNDRVCSITGFARTDLLGRSLAQITHPDDVAVDTVLARRLFAGSIPGYRVRKRLVTRGGTPIDVALTTTAVRGPDDRPAYGIATIEPAPAPDPGP